MTHHHTPSHTTSAVLISLVAAFATPASAQDEIETTSFVPDELSRINQAIEVEESTWNFLPGTLEQDILNHVSAIEIEGLSTLNVEIRYLPFGNMIIFSSAKAEDTFCADQDTLGALGTTFIERTAPLFENLKRSGYFESVDSIVRWDSEARNIQAITLCEAGSNPDNLTVPSEVLANLDHAGNNLETWQAALRLIKFSTTFTNTVCPIDRSALAQQFGELKDHYLEQQLILPAKLALAMINTLQPTVESMVQYSQLGKLSAEEVKTLPPPFHLAIQTANKLTEDIPGPIHYDRIRNEQDKPNITGVISQFLELEKLSGIYSPQVTEIATLEIQDGLRLVTSRANDLTELTPRAAGEIIRGYFETYYLNEYIFTDNTGGIAGCIATRRTDCSARAILALTFFESLGFETGVEIILPKRNEEVLHDALGHIYNWVKLDDRRLYFDFCVDLGQPYCFEDPKPIQDHYLGQNEVGLSISTSNELGILIDEPIINARKNFFTAFFAQPEDLAAFLTAHPESQKVCDHLKAYSKAKDTLFGTTESQAWESGTQESLRNVFEFVIAKK